MPWVKLASFQKWRLSHQLLFLFCHLSSATPWVNTSVTHTVVHGNCPQPSDLVSGARLGAETMQSSLSLWSMSSPEDRPKLPSWRKLSNCCRQRYYWCEDEEKVSHSLIYHVQLQIQFRFSWNIFWQRKILLGKGTTLRREDTKTFLSI